MRFFQYISILICFVCSLLLASDFTFSDIPVQEYGRIKPLDTFVRNQLLSIYGKRSLKENTLPKETQQTKMSAVEWLIDITLHPEEADKYKIFNIRSPEIVGSLGLHWDSNHLYSRSEVLKGLQSQLEYIRKIQSIPDDELSKFDQQILQLYSNVIRFQKLSYSFTCIMNLIHIHDDTLAKVLDVKPGDTVSYYYVMQRANELNIMVEMLSRKDVSNWSKADSSLGILLDRLNELKSP